MYASDLARIHHDGFGFVAENAARVLLDALAQATIASGTIVDLGCGSGILSRIVADAGYEVFGVDYSAPMLEIARRSVPAGRFAQASVLDVEIPACIAVAAVGEIFSYAFDARAGLEQFGRVARSIHEALVPGGVFLFDVAGPGRAGASPRTGLVDHDGWSIVHTSVEEGDILTRSITTFTRDGGTHRRSDERRILRLYHPDDVQNGLDRAGFETTRLKGYRDFTLPAGWHAFLCRVPTMSASQRS